MENLTLIQSAKIDSIFNELKEIRSMIESKEKEEQLEKWHSKQEAKKKLKVCSKTLDGYLARGILPYSRFAGKIYIKAADIEAHLQKHYVKS